MTNDYVLVILTKKDLSILPHFLDKVRTISEISNMIKCSYDSTRIKLRKLEKRGILVSVNNLHHHSRQKLYKIHPNLCKTIKEIITT